MRDEHTDLQAGQASWLDAAPFRAHVRHAVAEAGIPWPAFAIESGVPLPAVRSLLFGRGGRPVGRIEPRIAARLFSIGAAELAGLRRTHVAATGTAQRLRELLVTGVDPLALARWCAISPGELARLVDGDDWSCSRLTECLSLAAERMAAAAVPHQRAA